MLDSLDDCRYWKYSDSFWVSDVLVELQNTRITCTEGPKLLRLLGLKFGWDRHMPDEDAQDLGVILCRLRSWAYPERAQIVICTMDVSGIEALEALGNRPK